MKKCKLTVDVERGICNRYVAGELPSALAKEYSIGITTLKRILKRGGVVFRRTSGGQKGITKPQELITEKICAHEECPSRGTPQPISEFSLKKNGHYHSWCRVCRQRSVRLAMGVRRQDPVIHHQELLQRGIYRQTHREELNQKSRDDYRANPVKNIEKTKRWLKTPRGKENQKLQNQRRRERKRAVETIWNKEKRDAVIGQRSVCFNCGTSQHLTVDHIMPLSLGYPLCEFNAVVLCRECNSSKLNKHPRDFFVPTRYTLLLERFPLKEFTVKEDYVGDFIKKYHYLHSMPAVPQFSLGMFYKDEMVGACVFSSGPRSKKYDLELSRLCIWDTSPRNSESWFIARCLDSLKVSGFRGVVVSFADADVGHVGTIYKAANWRFDGTTRALFHFEKDGARVHQRKVRRLAREAGMALTEYATKFGYIKVKESGKSRWIYVIE